MALLELDLVTKRFVVDVRHPGRPERREETMHPVREIGALAESKGTESRPLPGARQDRARPGRRHVPGGVISRPAALRASARARSSHTSRRGKYRTNPTKATAAKM